MEKEAPEGIETKIKFAMWWATDKDKIFLKSNARKLLHELFEALDGIESYMLANLGMKYGFIEGEPLRVGLPEKRVLFIVESPDGDMMICASQEKGIQLKFDVSKVSQETRDHVLYAFLTAAKNLKGEVLKRKFPLDTYDSAPRPLSWFELLEGAIERQEKDGGETKFVGAEV